MQGNEPLAIDSWWHDLMLAWRTDAGLTVAHALAAIGAPVSMILFVVVVVAAYVVARRPWDAVTVATAVAALEVVTGLLKVGFARPRPEDSLATHAMTSYPSGHTSLAAVVAVVLALLLQTRIAWVLAAAWVVVMAWSRTYLAAHWLTDVIAGAILGASVAVLAWALVSTLRPAGAGAIVGDPPVG